MSMLDLLRKARFSFNGGYILVQDLETAARWYKQAFGCSFEKWMDEDGTPGMILQFGDDPTNSTALLESKGEQPDEVPPIIYTNSAEHANNMLMDRSVNVGPVQKDAQGTKFFEMRDCDGNVLEVSEEP